MIAQKQIKPNTENILSGIPEGYIPFFLMNALAYDKKKCQVFIASTPQKAKEVFKQIKAIDKNVNVFYLPGWDCLPYDRIGPSQHITTQRIETFTHITKEKSNYILILDPQSFLQKNPPPSYWGNKNIVYEKGLSYSRERFIEQLNIFGYRRCETVYEEGDYAVRGSIIDVFLVGQKKPVRVDFFDDEIESIKFFSIDTQMTLKEQGSLSKIHLHPSSEICWDEKAIINFKNNYAEIESDISLEEDMLYQSITCGKLFQGQEHWGPLAFNEPFVHIDDYMKEQGFCLYGDPFVSTILADQIALLFDYYKARVEPFVGDVTLRFLPPQFLYRLDHIFHMMQLSPYVVPDVKDYGARLLIDFPKRENNAQFIEELIAFIIEKKKGKDVFLACSSEGAKNRIFELFEEQQVHFDLPVYIMQMEKSFYTKDFVLITDQDILGFTSTVAVRKKKSHQRFFQELSELTLHDLIVHKDHGIGRYLGLEGIDIGGVLHDCLILEYDQGNRLYLPVENMDLISRYGSASAFTQLDRLGSQNWKNKKGQAKKRIEVIAQYLIETAAKRATLEGEVFTIPEKSYHHFCSQFPYKETEDQHHAIHDVIDDFSSGKPMDRLVCGDVGFGKTEVALRAAFLALAAKKQVAVITPTTLLCRQHSLTFLKRFQHEKYCIEQLSRLVPYQKAKQITKGLADGTVDLVVGTHGLLNKQISFKNLGLIIVDEEQHFGVQQKESLKTKYPNIHVLTLTATPIPRTLQLSFSGVRDLSLITTHPVDRMPVRTFIMDENPVVIKEAILREIHRGGQVFYVCPHIKNQKKIADMLKDLMPDLRFITVNGRMDHNDLEDAVTAFCDRQYDLLLATNIIESGIDMPSVNTIILHHAHLFGLAQLYQLRGRVGRSKMQAYAYFTVPQSSELTEQAHKRLKILQSLDTLGAGFHLASHDLDIRGSGNILGEEQSGHVKEVGVDLYQKMLQETMVMLKAKEVGEEYQQEWSPQINLGGAVLIPDSYIQDLSVRLSLYKRLSSFKDIDEIHPFAAELVDRFGKFPIEVKNLLHVTELKLLCKQTYVEKLEVGPKGFMVGFFQNYFPQPQKLLSWLQSEKMNKICKLRSDQKIFVQFQEDDLKKRYVVTRKFLLHLRERI